MPEREGEVTEIQMPAAGKPSGSCKVGGRKVWFYWNEYKSDQPSLIRQFLEDAQQNQVRVIVTGEEFQGSGPNGAYTSFTAKDVRASSQGAGNGSQGPQTGSYGQGQAGAPPPTVEGKRFVGREPGLADRWTATRWAYSLAAELLGRGEGQPSVTAIQKLADELFQASYVDALSHHEKAEEAPNEDSA